MERILKRVTQFNAVIGKKVMLTLEDHSIVFGTLENPRAHDLGPRFENEAVFSMDSRHTKSYTGYFVLFKPNNTDNILYSLNSIELAKSKYTSEFVIAESLPHGLFYYINEVSTEEKENVKSLVNKLLNISKS